jgi:hypothetical protein
VAGINITEGWTEPLDFELQADGVARPLIGASVAFLVWDKSNNVVTHTGTAVITAEATGLVRYSPVAGEFLATGSPYRYRWQITQAGKVSTHPNKATETMNVRKP